MKQHFSYISVRLVFYALVFFVLNTLDVKPANSQTTLAAWSTEFAAPGVNGNIRDFAWSPDGRLFVIGDFSYISGITSQGIAYLDGDTWNTISLKNAPFSKIFSIDFIRFDKEGKVFFRSTFFFEEEWIAGFAVWDGTQWEFEGYEKTVSSFEVVDENEFYAGECGGHKYGYNGIGLNRWHNNEWTRIGTMDCVAVIARLSGGQVIAVGNEEGFRLYGELIQDGVVRRRIDLEFISFTTTPAGDTYASISIPETKQNYIALWNGTDWEELPGSLGSGISQLKASPDNRLYVWRASELFSEDRVLERWDGSSWTTLFESPGGMILAGSVKNILPAGADQVYLSFIRSGLSGIASLKDGAAEEITTIGEGINGQINTFAPKGNRLYVGGRFSKAGNVNVANVVLRENEKWYKLGELSGIVQALAIGADNTLYAGGIINGISDSRIGIAQWDGSTWSELGDGLQANGFPDGFMAVYSLVVDDLGDLYVGGAFDKAGNQDSRRLARWSNDTWYPMTIPFDIGSTTTVTSLKVCDDNTLYVGLSEGNPNRLVEDGKGERSIPLFRWKNNEWTELGRFSRPSGEYIRVNALACDENGLYAGGTFDQVDGVSTRNIAHWDGSVWSPLTGGVNASVRALELNADGNLVAGGDFSWADQVFSRHLAMWNGLKWSTFGKGTEFSVGTRGASVAAFASMSADSFFIGGVFAQIDQISSANIAKFDFTLIDEEIRPAPNLELPEDFEGAAVYPNPMPGSGGYFQFEADMPGLASVAVYNNLGQRIQQLFEGEVNSDQVYQFYIAVDQLSSGSYFVVASTEGKKVRIPFIVIR